MDNKHPSAFSFITIITIILTAVLGSIIGMQLITSLGISANTSIIGAVFAMMLARIPLNLFGKFKSIHQQNLVQTSISAATFGAASSLLLPIGIPFVMGLPELILPLLIGVILAMFIDAILLYKFFDSKIFPAKEAWPPGIATAEAIKAGDTGGKRAKLLGVGILTGVVGSFLKIPMSAFGVAFIGNIWALTMFGIGLLLRGYSETIFGVDINSLYIPHGFMVGAGIIALFQVVLLIFRKDGKNIVKKVNYSRDEQDIAKGFSIGSLAYLLIAVFLAFASGVYTNMSTGMLIGFIIFAMVAAFAHELIVGIAAMHAGWFPAFAVALITLIIGILFGFPKEALALLVGYSASTGVAFADMGYDLKTGFILRGEGKNMDFEMEGRKQQLYTAFLAFTVTSIVVYLSFQSYFDKGLVAPVNHVFAATIEAGVSPEIGKQLLIWAIPGALLQLIGGSKRQMGVLFATGLLLLNPIAGFAVLAGIIIRFIIYKVNGNKDHEYTTIIAAGIIAGDALYNFFSSIFKVSKT